MSPRPVPKVLLVEDDAVLGRIYSCALVAAGFAVDLARDGAEGLERLLAGSYDVLVSDICMPRLNGLDMLREARRMRRDLPVIVMTAQIDTKGYEDALEMGAVRYLIKPMRMEQLARAVERAVALGAARAKAARKGDQSGAKVARR
jgi:DNA-binding NtrC family response regulator